MRFKKLGAVSALVAGSLAWMMMGAQVAQAAPLSVSASSVSLRMSWHVDVEATICDNTGSYVSINGNATLAALGLQVRFRNQTQNDKAKTNYLEATAELKLDNDGSTGWDDNGFYNIPKQPAFGGVGGNPWISYDPDGGDDASTATIEGARFSPVFLGRCVQGNKWGLNMADNMQVSGAGLIQALTCETNASKVGIDTDNGSSHVMGMVLFDNNKNKVVHERDAAARWDFETAPAWHGLKKGWGQNGFGGNPWVDARFFTGPGSWVDDDSDPLTADVWQWTPGGTRTFGTRSAAYRCKDMY